LVHTLNSPLGVEMGTILIPPVNWSSRWEKSRYLSCHEGSSLDSFSDGTQAFVAKRLRAKKHIKVLMMGWIYFIL
jgi:hypothetical protein